MGCSVNHCPKRHGIRNLSMEPDILVRGEEPCKFGANNTDDITEHGDQKQASIERKGETSTTRRPDRPC